MRYIAIEGNIGAGKTTLSKRLAEKWNQRLILEEFEENPFLTGFYENPQKYAFQLEMAFLADRFHQLKTELVEDLFQPDIIADYAPFKSLIFARNNLSEDEFHIYRRFWQISFQNLPRPDVVVYLHRDIQSLLSLIHFRGRSFEMGIAEEYLGNIQSAYFSYFKQITDFPVLIVDTKKYNLFNSTVFDEWFASQLKQKFNPGLNYL